MMKNQTIKVLKQEKLRLRAKDFLVQEITITVYLGNRHLQAKYKGQRRIVPVEAYGVRVESVMTYYGLKTEKLNSHDFGYITPRMQHIQELLKRLPLCKSVNDVYTVVRSILRVSEEDFKGDAMRELRHQLGLSKPKKKDKRKPQANRDKIDHQWT